MRPAGFAFSLGASLLLLTGCADPFANSQRLPTRAITPAPTLTPTLTPFSIAFRSYYEEGLVRQRAGDAEGALRSFTWAIQQKPDFAPAYVARGSVYVSQGKYTLALADADAALEADPTSASAYTLRGEVLRLAGRGRQALEAFDQALALQPSLKPETFRSRWLAARAARDGVRLVLLGREYAAAHRDDPLRYYYEGWALIEKDVPTIATRVLVEAIAGSPAPPAVLWFTLGHAYAATGSWHEAVTTFEAARALVEVGDTSLSAHSDQPVTDLFLALGRAYLGAGRCVDAETMVDYAIAVGVPGSEQRETLEEARACQTPTPTATPYPTTTPWRF